LIHTKINISNITGYSSLYHIRNEGILEELKLDRVENKISTLLTKKSVTALQQDGRHYI